MEAGYSFYSAVVCKQAEQILMVESKIADLETEYFQTTSIYVCIS